MMVKIIPLNILMLLVQGVDTGPPQPKLGPGGPAPPVGDVVPVDGAIWVLFFAIAIFVGYRCYGIWKSSRIPD